MRRDIMTIEEFLKEENVKYYNYCEAIIYKNGLISFAIPSHVLALIKVTGLDEETIYYGEGYMSLTDSPIHWLTNFTGCIPVWNNGYILPNNPTDEQLKTLEILINKKIIKKRLF